MRAQQELHPRANIGEHHYWLHGYIGNLQYCFELIVDNNPCNLLSQGVLHGDLLVHIERVHRLAPPPRGLDDLLMIWLKDKPSEDGGRCHDPKEGPLSGPSGPAGAQGQEAVASTEGTQHALAEDVARAIGAPPPPRYLEF